MDLILIAWKYKEVQDGVKIQEVFRNIFCLKIMYAVTHMECVLVLDLYWSTVG
jgi:hypothetical protein